MPRTARTLLLSATALVLLATAATAAAPTPSPSHPAGAGMASMHDAGTMPTDAGDMTAMHATMTTGPEGHEMQAMAAGCPMHTGDAMASMHRETGHDPAMHHREPEGDRP